jgi:hypothetical protein
LNDLEEALLKTQTYINPRKGDCVYVEWGNDYKNYNYETMVTGNKKLDRLVYYNNKWFVRMGEGNKSTYVLLHNIDHDAIVRKK